MGRSPRGLLLPITLAALFLAVALFGVDAHHAPAALAMFALLYLALATTLASLLTLASSFGRAAGFAAAWGVGILLVYHLRELTYLPGPIWAVPLAAAALAPLLDLATRHSSPSVHRHSVLARAGAGIVVTVIMLLVIHSADVPRWHLLRHHKMLGTPIYYLLTAPVDQQAEALYASHRTPSESAPTASTAPASSAPALTATPTRVDSSTLATSQPPSEEPAPRPHLVFLLLDTLRADALALGGGSGRMPRLDARLEEAWRFTDLHTNASWTRPSMASFLTGLLPEEHGARNVDDPLEEDLVLLPEILRDRGYTTAAFVSNVGAVGKSAGFAQGYDVFHEFLDARPYARAAQVRRTATAWLERQWDGSSPLFLYLHFLDPHEPYLAGRVPARKTRSEYLAAYDAELDYLDRELETLFGQLDTLLPGPYAVLIASDHGEEFFEHEEFGHGQSLYRELLRVPVALLLPGSPGGKLDARLEARDIFDLIRTWSDPTTIPPFEVTDWAASRHRARRDASVDYSTDGRLLLRPYLRRVMMRRVEHDGWALVWSAYGDTWELYDLADDPAEQHNLAAEHPEIVDRLRAEIDTGIGEWRFPEPYTRSAEEIEQLRDLGYLD